MDKLQLIQLLDSDVAREERIALNLPAMTVPIWSQFNATEGAETLFRVLQEEA